MHSLRRRHTKPPGFDPGFRVTCPVNAVHVIFYKDLYKRRFVFFFLRPFSVDENGEIAPSISKLNSNGVTGLSKHYSISITCPSISITYHFLIPAYERAWSRADPDQFRILHINTRTMASWFDELLATIKKYPFDVVTMSEPCFKDNALLLQYVTIPGYSDVFPKRKKIRGGGVGA